MRAGCTSALTRAGPRYRCHLRNVCRSSPRRAVSRRTWAGPVPIGPARSVHRDRGVERRLARLTSLVLGRSKAESSGLVFTTERGTAVDPRNALRAISTAAKVLGMSGVGLHTLRHTFAPRTCSRPECHCIPSRSYSGTRSSRSPGTCTATSPTRARALPFSGFQQQWAGENVCRCYTVATPLLHGSKEAASDFVRNGL